MPNRPASPAGRLIECTRCQFVFYFSPAATNAVIIENMRGEILLVERKNPPNRGLWDLPGGFIEFDESGEESTVREIKEELAIKLTNLKYFGSYADRYFFKGINYYTLNLVYVTKIKNEKPKAADDVVAYKFFPKNKIPYPRLAFPYMQKVLKDYLSSS